LLPLTGQVEIQLCSQPTNEVTYFRAVSSIVSLPTHLKPYVPLFCNIVTKYCVFLDLLIFSPLLWLMAMFLYQFWCCELCRKNRLIRKVNWIGFLV